MPTMINTMDTTMDKIDVHCHILYGIDDGSKTIEESLEIIKQHVEMGFKDIILTPHYIENSKYKTNNKEKQKILEEIKKTIKNNNIDVNVYLGNEVFVNNNLIELLEKQEIHSLNNSKYLLIELPMNTEIKNIKDILYELKIKGITPIIAHPERYELVQKNINYIKELIEEGAILQANYGSIIGIYGNKAKQTIKKLLKQNLITLLGTDIHYPNNKIYLNFDKITKKIKKIIGEEKFIEISKTNPKKILNNEEISKNY